MSRLQKLFWISLIVKIVIAGLIPLTSDEAYYWVWSQHMQLSFYDHPPFVAWLYWLGDFMRVLPGSVRWPGVVLGHVGLAVWLAALRPFLTEEQRYFWLWLMLLSPLAGGSALLVTPDLPLMFFTATSVAMFFMWQARTNWRHSLAFGLSVGLGFTSKYMIVLFVLSLFPLLFLSASIRRKFLTQIHWLLIGAAIGATPVWLWNVLNDFASFKFQATHGLGRAWKPSWTLHYFLAQIALLFPPVFYYAVKARRVPYVFHLLAWTPLVFFAFTTFRGYVEANWPIAAYPAVYVLAASEIPRNRKALAWTCGLWGFLFAAFAVIILLGPSWSKEVKLREFNQFDRVIEAGRGLQPLYARSYQMAAKMNFELRRPVYKLKGMNRKDFYDFLGANVPPSGTYYLAVEKGDVLPDEYAQRGDKAVEVIPVDERHEIWKIEAP